MSQFKLNFTPSGKGRPVQGRQNRGGLSTLILLLSLQGYFSTQIYGFIDIFTGWRQEGGQLPWADL